MDYSLLQVARTEHEERVRNVRPVYDYQQPAQAAKQGRVQQQMARALVALGGVLMVAGQRLMHDTSFTPDTTIMERPCVEC
jgi:hypothetical protein